MHGLSGDSPALNAGNQSADRPATATAVHARPTAVNANV